MPNLSLKNHPLFTASADINDLCKPLSEYFDITYFRYVRSYDNGLQADLCNNANWADFFYLEKKYHRISAFNKHPTLYQTGSILWENLHASKPILIEGKERFKIDHGITLIQRQCDSTEFFHFGTTPNNTHINNIYINNLDLFKRFALYFKDKAGTLIKRAETKKLSTHSAHKKHPVDDALLFNKVKTEAFINELSIQNYHLEGKLKGIILTDREFECVKQLAKGKTAKNIAQHLALSPRTIEGYINKIKIKINCQTKSEMISLLVDHGINLE